MRNPHIPGLQPDESSQDRQFLEQGPPPGSPPMVFFNADPDPSPSTHAVTDVPEILFVGLSLVVSKRIRDKLLLTPVQDMFLHPALYIDEKKGRHEDYWYLTLSRRIDCWDREESVYPKHLPIHIGNLMLYDVMSLRLNDTVLDEIPLKDRLLFKMGGVVNAHVVCHESLLPIFSSGDNSGAKFVRISEQ